MIALIDNWWTLFVRLTNPDTNWEAEMSRPLLLSSVGRLTQTVRQKPIKITSQHSAQDTLKAAWISVGRFFNQLKRMAPPLTRRECWARILSKSMAAFMLKRDDGGGQLLAATI